MEGGFVMDFLENVRKLSLELHIKEKTFVHATFLQEEYQLDKLRFSFHLPKENTHFTIDITLKNKKVLQLMTGTVTNQSIDSLDGKIEDVLEWFYAQICNHSLFRLPVLMNHLQFKFVKVQGNVVYRHQLSFLEEE